MPHEPKTITIDEASELARMLAEAAVHPLRLTAGAVSYRVTRLPLATNPVPIP